VRLGHHIGVIDLGSNTFHLHIVNKELDKFQTIYKQRIYTFLSEGGLEEISDLRTNGAFAAIEEFKRHIDRFQVDTLKIIGTAAIRKSKNSSVLCKYILDTLGTPVDIIDGNQEASYIFAGIMLFPECNTGDKLIMDIGGGSTELMIVDEGLMIWSKSYPLGVGLLHAKFAPSDPITSAQIKEIKAHIVSTVADLKKELDKSKKPRTLIGSSGSFEVLLSMSGKNYEEEKCVPIPEQDFDLLHSQVVPSTLSDRNQMSGLPSERSKLIVMAMILKEVIIKEINVTDNILFCPYALKEGVLASL
jgi:exopolyphosphatase / guanosine-5'-triphosphate,3'-diphosphate pyrophosphatase